MDRDTELSGFFVFGLVDDAVGALADDAYYLVLVHLYEYMKIILIAE